MCIRKWLSLVSSQFWTHSPPHLQQSDVTHIRHDPESKKPKRWDLFLDMTVYLICCIVFFAPQRKMASLHLADGLHNNSRVSRLRSGPQMVLAWNKRRGGSSLYTIEMQGVENINVMIRVRVQLHANLDTEFKMNVASARFADLVYVSSRHSACSWKLAPTVEFWQAVNKIWRNISVIKRSDLFASPREMSELSVVWRHCMRWHLPEHCVLSKLHFGFHITSTTKIQVV